METEKNVIIKHNVKSACVLGVMTSIGVFWILFAVELLLIYIQTGETSTEPSVAIKGCIFNLFICIIVGWLVVFLNCKVRRLVIAGDKFIYRNVLGREKSISPNNIVEIKRKDATYLILLDNNGKAFCTIEENMENVSWLLKSDEDFCGTYEEFMEELQKQEEKFKQYLIQQINHTVIPEVELIRDERKMKILFLMRVRVIKEGLGYYSDHLQLQPCEHFIPFAGYEYRDKKGYFLQPNKYQNELDQLNEWMETLIKRECFCSIKSENNGN